MVLVTGSLFSVRPAEAYTVTLEQMGSNVVATGSGAINLTGLTLSVSGAFSFVQVWASAGVIETGGVGQLIDAYTGFAGPTSFGSGGLFFANTSSGDFVGINATDHPDPFIAVPQNYVSGAALSSSATFDNATIHSLGLRPGTYVWSWGTGLPNQNFTLRVVPDGGSTISLLGCALLGLAALRRKLPLLRGKKS
jgi:hypothetical protein